MKRTLLFLDYWSLHEPLTQATVLPTLRMLLEEELAERVLLVTVERGPKAVSRASALGPGLEHVPLIAHDLGLKPLARALDLLKIVPRVSAIAREQDARFLMARGVVAGGFAHFVHRRTGIPYAVDYFEPHNDYMTDVGEWTKGGLLDRGLSSLIRSQQRTAQYCVCVTRNYRERLVAMGANKDRLLVAPCPVDEQKMHFDPEQRARIRAELRWSDGVIAVYAGKFGGLYHREHAFRAFAEAQRIVGDGFGLVLLTPHPEDEVRSGLRSAGYVGDRVLVKYAEHHEVPAYLSASDIAFAPYRGTISSACISPMKIGEYWANGLPVLLTRGVGDDSAIIEQDPYAGAVFDPEGSDLPSAMLSVLRTIAQKDQRIRTSHLATKYRSMDRTREAYRTILGNAWGTVHLAEQSR